MDSLRDWLTMRVVYARYLAASAVSLGFDLTTFTLLLRTGTHAIPASLVGYCTGLLVHWLLSSRLVFTDGAPLDAVNRTRQKLLFIVSALVGLGITGSVVTLGSLMDIHPHVAKLFAVALSFQATYLLRRKIVFA